jgi:hypothetical protein
MPRPPLNAVVDDSLSLVGAVAGASSSQPSAADHHDAGDETVPPPSAAAAVPFEAASSAMEEIADATGSPASTAAAVRALSLRAGSGGGVLSFLDTLDASRLRGVCAGARAAVASFPWNDLRTRITGPLRHWRASFPKAKAASIRGRSDLRDADFDALRGLESLDMGSCAPAHALDGISDAAFERLRGISRLSMPYCCSERITDLALDCVAGVREIDVSFCTNFSDAGFASLAGVQKLFAGGCVQLSDAALTHLAGLHTLSLFGCRQQGLTRGAFAHLRGIKELVVYDSRPDLVDAASAVLGEVHGVRGRDVLTN